MQGATPIHAAPLEFSALPLNREQRRRAAVLFSRIQRGSKIPASLGEIGSATLGELVSPLGKRLVIDGRRSGRGLHAVPIAAAPAHEALAA